MNDFYVLDKNREPQPCPAREWAQRFDFRNRIVAQEWLGKNLRVSTVFVGLDRGEGCFETMVFGGKYDRYQQHCSTWAEAERQHARVLNLVKLVKEENDG